MIVIQLQYEAQHDVYAYPNGYEHDVKTAAYHVNPNAAIIVAYMAAENQLMLAMDNQNSNKILHINF